MCKYYLGNSKLCRASSKICPSTSALFVLFLCSPPPTHTHICREMDMVDRALGWRMLNVQSSKKQGVGPIWPQFHILFFLQNHQPSFFFFFFSGSKIRWEETLLGMKAIPYSIATETAQILNNQHHKSVLSDLDTNPSSRWNGSGFICNSIVLLKHDRV